jgi:hypothetical protein
VRVEDNDQQTVISTSASFGLLSGADEASRVAVDDNKMVTESSPVFFVGPPARLARGS